MADAKTETPKMKKGVITQDFKDTNFNHTGIERNFKANSEPELPEGVYENYLHAGLVKAPDDKGTKPSA